MPGHAQWSDAGSHGSWPVDVELTTATGTVSIDASHTHPIYYLDQDGDGEMDLLLRFGPFWYSPDSGAVRPDSGETISVVGLFVETGGTPSLVVFELDGLSWREPVEYGMHGWNGSDAWTTTFDTLTVSGVVLVDTTYYYRHYYLDEDGDSIPDYQLVFGPQWYEPAGGAMRPDAGDEITVFGAVHEMNGAKRLMVYELDGLEWRTFGGPATWAGHWMGSEIADTSYAYCVNDSANWIAFPPGHAQGGMGMMHWPDSMFVEFWRIPPDSLPGDPHSGRFAGFFVDVHNPAGGSMMGPDFGGHQGMMSFARPLRIRLHYHDEDLPGGSDDGMHVATWDEEMHDWMSVGDALVDTEANTVWVTGSDLSAYYALVTPDVATGISSDPALLPSGIALYQNFPNPFAVHTEIAYRLFEARHVKLAVFDLLGRRVTTLVDQMQPAGSYEVGFVPGDRAGGVYFVRLESDGAALTRRMLLVR